MRVILLADSLSRDAIYTFRTLRKNPAFAVTAILTLALGIGADTAIFTTVRAVLLRPLQYRDPDRVVELSRGVTPIRKQVLAIDPGQPISAVYTMDELAQQGEGERRLVLLMLGVFAAAAVLLTTIGMYGTIAYWVLQRTRELGIRRALGAPIGNIVWIVIGRGLAFASAGLAVGIVGSIALTRFIQSFLFHVSPTDPLTFATVTLLTLAVSLVATLIPAQRAVRRGSYVTRRKWDNQIRPLTYP